MFSKAFNVFNRAIIISSILTLFFLTHCAQSEEEILIVHKNFPNPVTYDLYMPKGRISEPVPVVVCVGGLPVIDGKYSQSSTQECMNEKWKDFADDNHVAILGVGFLFIEKDWQNFESYQFPNAWSARALSEIFENLTKDYPLNYKELYFFGISAGAQYATRFALLYPKITKAVCAHSAGGYSMPANPIPTKFLITVGALDNEDMSRTDMAQRFVEACRKKGIEATLEIIPDLGHKHIEKQDRMSRDFFKKIIKKNK